MPDLSKDEEDILGTIEAVYDAALDPSGWSAVFASLRQRFRSPVAGMFTQDAVTGAYDSEFLHGISDKYNRLYAEHIAAVNPWIRVPGLMRPGRVLTDESLERLHRDSQAYVETEFHQDFARPQRFRHTMGGTVVAHGHKLVNFTYFRPANAGSYTDAEVRLHARLARHIGKAVGMGRQFDALKRELSASSSLIDRLAFGVILLDADGRIRNANREARRLLADGDGLGATDGVLWARHPAEDRRLKALIRSVTVSQAIACEAPGDQAIVSRLSGRMALSIVALPLPRDRAFLGLEASAAILLVSDPERQPILQADAVAERFGFSRGEARLAVLLAQGYDLRRAAAMAGLSYETSRAYLKLMFQKTGVRRQAALVRLLLSDVTVAVAQAAANPGS